MALIQCHLIAQDWRLADELMQEEAIKTLKSRPALKFVVYHIRKTCFHNAVKTPTIIAIIERYERHFLGPSRKSLVRQGDTMIKSASKSLLKPTPSKLAEDIKDKCFKDSPSLLHCTEAIESRYKQRLMEMEADEMMKSAAQPDNNPGIQQYEIGAVVNYIKQRFFADDPSTTKGHIHDRYCRRWLRIGSSAAEIEAYEECRAQRLSTVPRAFNNPSRTPHQHSNDYESVKSDISNPLPFGFPLPPSQLPFTAPDTPHPVSPTVPGTESIEMSLSAIPSQFYFNDEHTKPSNLNLDKRTRKESLDSTPPTPTTDRNSYKEISRPPLHKLQQNLRDSGVFSVSSASDTSSLFSRTSRLSIDVKPCMLDHGHEFVGPCSPCALFQYDEFQDKHGVYIASEFASTQRADVVDRDEMDNGVLTCDANVGISC